MRDISWVYKKAKDNQDIILYEYIDEIHQDITGEIPNFVLENHNELLEDEENCIVIASADKLIKDVASKRSENYTLVTNGVDINHFKKIDDNKIPISIEEIVGKNKPIIGYFGAFASWFDYELIKKLAQERPQYEILLIGWDYDKSISKYKLHTIPNINIIGPIHYSDLPNYAQYFDVSTIPFLINEVTESTSPVKLFEYMAMGKPIVTTNMKECRKYQSVLIGKTELEFIHMIDEALKLKTAKEYLNILSDEAHENNWEKKASSIDLILKQSMKL
jgi:teichuronic acid biosynthesis glycosyltransferase TuaH